MVGGPLVDCLCWCCLALIFVVIDGVSTELDDDPMIQQQLRLHSNVAQRLPATLKNARIWWWGYQRVVKTLKLS